jgi:hypothetical protein
MVLEGAIGLLVALLTYNVSAIKTNAERALDNANATNITIEGMRYQLQAHAALIDRIDAIQRRNSELIIEIKANHR